MGKALSPKQEEMRDEQIEENRSYLTRVDDLLVEIEPFIDETEKYITILQDLYNKLDKAHGMLMLGQYTNYYTKHLNPPSSPLFKMISNGISEEYKIIDEKTKEMLTKDLPDRKNFVEDLSRFKENIKPFIEDVAANNSFIVRFEEMDSIYNELKEVAEKHWVYPVEIVQREVLNNRQCIVPIFLHGLPTVYPFHIQTYLDLRPQFNSAILFKGKLLTVRRLLTIINKTLPFTELKENVPTTSIKNVVTGVDKSTEIGSNVTIGEHNAIGDGAVVGSEE